MTADTRNRFCPPGRGWIFSPFFCRVSCVFDMLSPVSIPIKAVTGGKRNMFARLVTAGDLFSAVFFLSIILVRVFFNSVFLFFVLACCWAIFFLFRSSYCFFCYFCHSARIPITVTGGTRRTTSRGCGSWCRGMSPATTSCPLESATALRSSSRRCRGVLLSRLVAVIVAVK